MRTIILFTLTVFVFNSKLNAFPGGYIGLSFLFDFKSKEKGMQVSTGLALPFIGDPGMGPYAFPGLAFGLRHTNSKSFYGYIDIQFVASNAVWIGSGYGIAFKDGNRFVRKKYFLGFLPIGYVIEGIQKEDSINMDNNFKGIYLGAALPIIGNHFFP